MKNSIKAITVLTKNSAALTGGYDSLVATGLPQACSIIRVLNASNTLVGLSYDGVHTNDWIPAGTLLHLDFNTISRSAWLAKGSKISLIGAAGVGTIYFSGYYQEV